YRRLGNQEKAKEHLVRFQHLTQTKIGAPITLAYGDQGPLSLVAMVAGAENQVEAPIPVKFTNASADAGLSQSAPEPLSAQSKDLFSGRGACFFDYDNDGKPDLFLAAGTGHGASLYHNLGNGKFEDVTKAAGFDALKDVVTCAAADYDAD